MGNDDRYIHYGCGTSAPTTWRNFDISPTLRIQRIPIIGGIISARDDIPLFPDNVEYGDIVEGLPVKTNTADGIYCSHVLEHLALEDMRTALENTYKYLKSGGVFRLVVPDLERYIQEYVSSEEPDSAHKFMQTTLLGQESRPQGLEAVARQIFGNAAHRWMWDEPAMRLELERVGFKCIRRAEYGDSEDSHFTAVENKARWKGNLGMDCKKP